MNSNIGRSFAIKEAFVAHLMRGVDEIIPTDQAIQTWLNRERHTRVAICADRMIDDVQKLLAQYRQGGKNGIHAPIPMILVAFGKDFQAVEATKSLSTPNHDYVQFEPHGQVYKMRTDHILMRCQLAFFAHTSETAKSITSQLRLYFSRFQKYRFPVHWHFGGYDFDLTASLQEPPFSDEIADLPERGNLTVLTWTINIQAQMPYLNAPMPHTLTIDGKIKGYLGVQTVHLSHNI